MVLTRNALIAKIIEEMEFTKKDATDSMEQLIEIIKSTLASGEDVLISGFGKFCVKSKSERRGRNPATGQDMVLGARRVVTFRCSPVLRNKIVGNDEANA